MGRANAKTKTTSLSERRKTVEKGTAPQTSDPVVPAARAGTKSALVIDLLKSKNGATIAEMIAATGWQAHSVRGFLAGSLRKRHGLTPQSTKVDGDERRYRVR